MYGCKLNFRVNIILKHKTETEKRNEPEHNKTYKMACVPSEDSDQPGHLPSLIRVFAVHMKKACVLGYSMSYSEDWVDAQTNPSLRWLLKSYCRFCHGWLKWFLIRYGQSEQNTSI